MWEPVPPNTKWFCEKEKEMKAKRKNAVCYIEIPIFVAIL